MWPLEVTVFKTAVQCVGVGWWAPGAHVGNCLGDAPCTGHRPFPGSFPTPLTLLKTICPQILVSESASDGPQTETHPNNPGVNPTTPPPTPDRRGHTHSLSPSHSPVGFPISHPMGRCRAPGCRWPLSGASQLHLPSEEVPAQWASQCCHRYK